MTLLFQLGVHDLFIFATSDTMRRKKYFDHESNESTGVYGFPEETKDKVSWVSNYVVATYGGYESFAKEPFDRLKKLVKSNTSLSECKPILEKVLEEINEEKADDSFFQKYKESKMYGAYLIGYDKDGTTGMIAIEENKIIHIKSSQMHGCIMNMFAPTKELLDKVADIFDFSKDGLDLNNPLESTLSILSSRQALIAYTHPEYVSSTMLYKGFIKGPNNEILPFEGEVDLTETIIAIDDIQDSNRKL